MGGDLFIDEGLITYVALDFKIMTFLQVFSNLLSVATSIANAPVQNLFKVLGTGGNLSGEKSPLGGCLVVETGGGDKPLLHYIQQGVIDHVANNDVLKALDIKDKTRAAILT